MPICYTCGASVQTGLARRRWVITGETTGVSVGRSSRVYASSHRGLRTLCLPCASALDTARASQSSRAIATLGVVLAITAVSVWLATARRGPTPSAVETSGAKSELENLPRSTPSAETPDGWWESDPCCNCSVESVVTLGSQGSGLRVGSRWTGPVERQTLDGLSGEQDLQSNPYQTFIIRTKRSSKSSNAWRVVGVWGCNGTAMP